MVRCTFCTIIVFMVTGASLARAQWSPSAANATDQVDRTIEEQMKRRGIPGLSLAIIQDGKIVKAKGYGFADRDKKTPVSASTLFQAGPSASRWPRWKRSIWWKKGNFRLMKT